MKRVVVDASVVVAGLLKDGSVRDTLLSSTDVTFAAPAYLREEVARHLADVADRAHVPNETVRAVLEDLLSAIELVPPGIYSGAASEAQLRARAPDALEDSEYVALALALEAPVWTLDKDFARIRGVRVLSTREVGSPGSSGGGP